MEIEPEKRRDAIVQICSSDHYSLNEFNKEKTDYDRKKLSAYGLTKDGVALKESHQTIQELLKPKPEQRIYFSFSGFFEKYCLFPFYSATVLLKFITSFFDTI
jgi:hypothetical protein